ncbi:single-stranded DNA-binding protein [Legionella septentrionalis]|nr:single-stranded DNA-binding protein [Legionella septentrionalis]
MGNLGADPKSIAGKDGQSFVTATLATNELFKQNDEWQTRVEWHQLMLFGKLTKVAEYLKKGSQVYLEGKLRSNQWTDNEGKARQALSIIVSHIQLLSPPKSADESSNKTAEQHMTQMREMLQPDSEEIPF